MPELWEDRFWVMACLLRLLGLAASDARVTLSRGMRFLGNEANATFDWRFLAELTKDERPEANTVVYRDCRRCGRLEPCSRDRTLGGRTPIRELFTEKRRRGHKKEEEEGKEITRTETSLVSKQPDDGPGRSRWRLAIIWRCHGQDGEMTFWMGV